MLKIPWAQGRPGVTLETFDTGGERAQVILVWVKVPGIGNASHPGRLGFMKVRLQKTRSSWREDYRIMKIISIRGVS
jgi:hypothetical protein